MEEIYRRILGESSLLTFISLPQLMRGVEKRILQAAQAIYGSNTRAAQALGIGRTTLVMKLKKHGLPISEPSNPIYRASDPGPPRATPFVEEPRR